MEQKYKNPTANSKRLLSRPMRHFQRIVARVNSKQQQYKQQPQYTGSKRAGQGARSKP